MGAQEWQEYDGAYKELTRLRGLDLLTFFGVQGRVEIEKVDSIALRVKERRLDAVFEVRVNGVERIIAVECEHTIGPPLGPRLLIALGVLAKRFPNREIETYVLGLTGGRGRVGQIAWRCGATRVLLRYPIVPLRVLSASDQIEAAPLGIMPFLPLMGGVEEALFARAQERIVREAQGPEEAKELLENLYIFAGIKFSKEVIVAIANRIRQKNSYLELKAELRAEGKAEGKVEGKAEGKVEGKVEGEIAGRQRLLAELIGKKFPRQKRTLIHGRLKDIEDAALLDALALRVLDELSWQDFWSGPSQASKSKSVAPPPALKRSRRKA